MCGTRKEENYHGCLEVCVVFRCVFVTVVRSGFLFLCVVVVPYVGVFGSVCC